ncbi:glycosyltransferase family 39 protein [Hyphomicrobium sp.]|uniref:ArnT family glycosyltransferase n=1 Tax=Hyphomicrobium sp. TaxID=82 RepID=UPI002B7C9701|nr:glycosyltransferase family 39 protein [Hyphomicrobium sp.]HVZ05715.1 glycosyltransferase family 39 protein [Hyphomicrobium sp.]
MERRRSLTEGWTALASRPQAASLALLLLCLVVYLPGFVRLPAVDRTEAIYAETTRSMVERGDWADPRYGTAVHQYRPIGTFWAQGLSRLIWGEAHARDIQVYRLPSLIFVTLTVLSLFWLGTAIVGTEAALIAAALFAVAPLTVLVSQLAIAEGLSLLPATIAMLALARIYASAGPKTPEQALHNHPRSLTSTEELRLALLFWVATGIGMLINALLVPILVLSTLIALYAFDRDVSWLKRLRPLVGIPLALVIASPWLLVRAHQDGTPFAGMDWRGFLAALGGAQDMKLRAFPGTFVLALLLGFIPGTALLMTAFNRLWRARDQRLPRFLLAWVIGYLIYLEALSSKPGTYMVQTMFPALALAVASVVVSETGGGKRPEWGLLFWPTGLAVIPVAVFAAVYGFAGQMPSLFAAMLIAIIASLFIWSGRLIYEGLLRGWATIGVVALGLFAITLLGVVLPSIDKIWPAQQLKRAVAHCPETSIDLVGFREPTSRFVLGVSPDDQSPETIAKNKIPSGLLIVEDRWVNRMSTALAANSRPPLPAPSGCVSAYNAMRGCPLHFRIYDAYAGSPCELPPQFACRINPEPAGPEKSGHCD